MKPRVIPLLLLHDDGVINTTTFKKKQYIGDPLNTVKLFNELEVDELAILDFDASKMGKGPNFSLLDKIRQRSFFPLAYGGGITTAEQAERLIRMGIEKVILNTVLFEQPDVVADIIQRIGAQSVCLSIDIKKNWLGRYKVFSHTRKKCLSYDPLVFIRTLLDIAEPGEIIITSVDADGSQSGYDLPLLTSVVNSFPSVPIVINGGAGKLLDFKAAVEHGAHAAAGTSAFVFKNGGVLINYPEQVQLHDLFGEMCE